MQKEVVVMSKVPLMFCLALSLFLSACASNTTSQKGLKKSPCACVFKPIENAGVNQI